MLTNQYLEYHILSNHIDGKGYNNKKRVNSILNIYNY